MKIAFVCAEDEIPGVCYLSSHLKNHGHQVFLVFEPKQFSRAYLRNDRLAKIFSRERENLTQLSQINPDLIGFSCTTAHYQWALDFSKKVKQVLPSTPIIFGGTHSTLVPELVMKEKSIDFVCVGEGEDPLLELVTALMKHKTSFPIKNIWYKRGGKVVKNPLRPLRASLDDLPHIDKGIYRGHLPDSYFTHSYFFTSRGCPYNCSYCGVEQLRKIVEGLGTFVRRMSPRRAVEELVILKKKYGTRYILFEDDIFALDLKWLKEFIPLYKKRVNLPFTCFGHTRLFNDEMARLLTKGGCDLVWFGVQSANETIRKNVFQRLESNDQIRQAASLCHKYRLKFMVDHILNVPMDNYEAIKEAISLYNTIRPAVINCYNLLYFPKAKINDFALKSGLIKKKDINLINQGRHTIYQTGDLHAKKEDYYTKYALLISSVPLMPAFVVEMISKSDKLISIFSQLPLFLIPLVKIVLNFKAGRGFLPLAVLRMEIFFTTQFIKQKLVRLIFNTQYGQKT